MEPFKPQGSPSSKRLSSPRVSTSSSSAAGAVEDEEPLPEDEFSNLTSEQISERMFELEAKLRTNTESFEKKVKQKEQELAKECKRLRAEDRKKVKADVALLRKKLKEKNDAEEEEDRRSEEEMEGEYKRLEEWLEAQLKNIERVSSRREQVAEKEFIAFREKEAGRLKEVNNKINEKLLRAVNRKDRIGLKVEKPVVFNPDDRVIVKKKEPEPKSAGEGDDDEEEEDDDERENNEKEKGVDKAKPIGGPPKKEKKAKKAGEADEEDNESEQGEEIAAEKNGAKKKNDTGGQKKGKKNKFVKYYNPKTLKLMAKRIQNLWRAFSEKRKANIVLQPLRDARDFLWSMAKRIQKRWRGTRGRKRMALLLAEAIEEIKKVASKKIIFFLILVCARFKLRKKREAVIIKAVLRNCLKRRREIMVRNQRKAIETHAHYQVQSPTFSVLSKQNPKGFAPRGITKMLNSKAQLEAEERMRLGAVKPLLDGVSAAHMSLTHAARFLLQFESNTERQFSKDKDEAVADTSKMKLLATPFSTSLEDMKANELRSKAVQNFIKIKNGEKLR